MHPKKTLSKLPSNTIKGVDFCCVGGIEMEEVLLLKLNSASKFITRSLYFWGQKKNLLANHRVLGKSQTSCTQNYVWIWRGQIWLLFWLEQAWTTWDLHKMVQIPFQETMAQKWHTPSSRFGHQGLPKFKFLPAKFNRGYVWRGDE